MLYLLSLLVLCILTALQLAPALPPPWLWLLPLVLAAALARAAPLTWQGRLRWLLLATTLWGVWAHLASEQRLQSRLDSAAIQQTLSLQATIIDIPQVTPERTRVLVRLDRAVAGLQRGTPLQLTRHESRKHPGPSLLAGQRWHFSVRLKPAHGLLNLSGHDREAWLWAHGIRATGSIRHATYLGHASDFRARLARLRAHVSHDIQRYLHGRPSAGLIAGLVVGDTSAIPSQQWQTWIATATVHAVSISGLHITLVAAQAAWLCGWLWQRYPRAPLILPTRKVAALGAVLAAIAYSLLAGFSVPTQRTLFMLLALLASIVFGRLGLLQSLAVALLVVLALDPFAVLTPGLWLSFGAVACMSLGVHGQVGHASWIGAWWRAQLAVTLGLAPATLVLTGSLPLSSPLANALAIPLISALITPLALLGSAAMHASPWLLQQAETVASLLLTLLQALEHLGQWPIARPPGGFLLLGVAGALIIALPAGIPGRWTGGVLLLPMLSWAPTLPPLGGWRATVLDVGQGLAVVVQTHRHTLLYDAGPDWPGDGDSGARTVLPALRMLGLTGLDWLIISHNDLDHSGGANTVIQSIPPRAIIAALPADHPLRSQRRIPFTPCVAGLVWQVDGVELRTFNPMAAEAGADDNDRSCVVRLQGRWASLLLPGDIGSRREHKLAHRWGEQLRSSVMLAPHHGSNGSSSMSWITRVQAAHVVFSAGYRNHFRHPHPAVQARLAGSVLWRTDQQGQIDIDSSSASLRLSAAVQQRRQFWRNPERFTDTPIP